jgi:hypothetical protein
VKTIFRILAIFLIGVLVSGGMYLILQNTTLGSEMSGVPNFDQASAADAKLSEPPKSRGGESDHHAASLEKGLSEVLVSLAKISAITVIVLFMQSLVARLSRRKVAKPMDR